MMASGAPGTIAGQVQAKTRPLPSAGLPQVTVAVLSTPVGAAAAAAATVAAPIMGAAPAARAPTLLQVLISPAAAAASATLTR